MECKYLVVTTILIIVYPLVTYAYVWRFQRINGLPGWMQIRTIELKRSEIVKDYVNLIITLYESFPTVEVEYSLKVYLNSDGNISSGDPHNNGADILLYFSKKLSCKDVNVVGYSLLYYYDEDIGSFNFSHYSRIAYMVANATTLLFTLPLDIFCIEKLNESLTVTYLRVTYEHRYSP